ncbi:J domain-containing protein [Candidatus Woesearchaeota archaeon]|nr:J domain-containing protein [Candidatus Woesearchaeota archaeon]
MATIRGRTIEAVAVRDSFSRRATQYKNKILQAFKNAGIPPDSVDIPEERAPMRKLPAQVSWYAQGSYCHYSYARSNNYTENLHVIMRLLEQELQAVSEGTKPAEEFIKEYAEDDDVTEKRKEARKTLGVDEDCMDFATIDSQYKKLAKDAHPDMPNGSTEEFKKINNAHKTLKRELE